MNIGTKIQAARRQSGMTQSALADKMCVTRQTISRWESGAALPDIEKLAQMAGLLQVSCDYLLNAEHAEETKDTTQISQESNNCVTELLRSLVGKRVHISFYEDVDDFDIYDDVCQVIGFDGNWMKIYVLKKNETKESLIALSDVLSFEILEGV